jgi:hypothetical protein
VSRLFRIVPPGADSEIGHLLLRSPCPPLDLRDAPLERGLANHTGSRMYPTLVPVLLPTQDEGGELRSFPAKNVLTEYETA